MKAFGIVLMVAGVIWMIVAFSMKTTVTSPSQSFGSGAYAIETPSVTVNNIGLMDRRRNNLMLAGLTILVGAVFVGFGSMSKRSSVIGKDEADDERVTCPYCAELIKAEAKVCKHCGRDVSGELAEAHERRAEAEAEAVSRQERKEILLLCERLKNGRGLTYDDYYKIARAGGVSLNMPIGAISISRRYAVTQRGQEIKLKGNGQLRAWLLENVVPQVERHA